jgi:superfamily II DNA or RNA helicase
LDTLFLAMPISWRGTLQQYVGRLHRLHENKQVVRVYDYIDASFVARHLSLHGPVGENFNENEVCRLVPSALMSDLRAGYAEVSKLSGFLS